MGRRSEAESSDAFEDDCMKWVVAKAEAARQAVAMAVPYQLRTERRLVERNEVVERRTTARTSRLGGGVHLLAAVPVRLHYGDYDQ